MVDTRRRPGVLGCSKLVFGAVIIDTGIGASEDGGGR